MLCCFPVCFFGKHNTQLYLYGFTHTSLASLLAAFFSLCFSCFSLCNRAASCLASCWLCLSVSLASNVGIYEVWRPSYTKKCFLHASINSRYHGNNMKFNISIRRTEVDHPLVFLPKISQPLHLFFSLPSALYDKHAFVISSSASSPYAKLSEKGSFLAGP